MHFNPYGEDPIRLAVELVNDPCSDERVLAARCAEAGLILQRTPTAADLVRITAFLRRWLRVVTTDTESARAVLLNELLAEYAAPPRLTDHAGTGWHLHFREEDLPVHRQVAALVSVGTALHLTGRGMDRLGPCQADGCTKVYADISRNGRQRFCSPACGNRAAVRRHRERTAAG
ncbi:CGNR zinc finger domain-containing protein [Nakamurella silvestris]|nr:CGNR zinc finger domain-containing protein [Nakamurella silvestris]